MQEPDATTYEEFWPTYVRAHRKPLTRIFHAVGTTAAVGTVLLAALTRRRALLPVALVVGYGPAWVSHFFIEGNRPATFQHPLWSLRGDFDMLGRMLQGTMAAEVERCMAMVADPVTPADAAVVAHGDTPANGTSSTVTNGHGSDTTPDHTLH